MLKQFRSAHGDNYSYLVFDSESEQRAAILVDPVASEEVKKFLVENNLSPLYVINTHGHGDHTQGNRIFQLDMGGKIVCHPLALRAVGKADNTVEDGDILEVGTVQLRVLHTPGHTDGSICLIGEDYIISGDTLFLAGCGNPKFGGDTKKLFQTIRKKLRPLPGALKVYPGHDYSIRNLEFAADIEPNNKLIARKLQHVRAARLDGKQPSSNLAEEHKYNPFFRYDDEQLVARLEIHASAPSLPAEHTDWDIFQHLRILRNNW